MVFSQVLRLVPDKLYCQLQYYRHFNRFINFSNPRTFNEKLQWMKLYNRNPLMVGLVDKVKVKSIISKAIGEKYVIPTLGVWDSPEKIDYESLPDSFVLKCNHNSGGIIICKEKAELDIEEANKVLRNTLKSNFYWYSREWPYKDVKPVIICEPFIHDSNGELKDYKFFCMNGRVFCFKIDFDRFSGHRANYYDRELKILPFGEKICPPDFSRSLVIPENIFDMFDIAERLSKEFPFVRVDLYNVDGKILFGEMTFFPANGCGPFTDDEWDLKLGNMINMCV